MVNMIKRNMNKIWKVTKETAWGRKVGVSSERVLLKNLKFNDIQFDQASRNVRGGDFSKKPVDVFYDIPSGEYRLMDGHHRFIRAIQTKQATILAKVYYGELGQSRYQVDEGTKILSANKLLKL